MLDKFEHQALIQKGVSKSSLKMIQPIISTAISLDGMAEDKPGAVAVSITYFPPVVNWKLLRLSQQFGSS